MVQRITAQDWFRTKMRFLSIEVGARKDKLDWQLSVNRISPCFYRSMLSDLDWWENDERERLMQEAGIL